MAQPSLHPFDLALDPLPGSDQLQLRVLGSPASLPLEPLAVPDPLKHKDAPGLLESTRRPDAPLSDLRRLGQLLSLTLTPAQVAAQLQSILRNLADPDTPLRMRLLLGNAALRGLPWELTYDEAQDTFLAIDPLVRLRRMVQPATTSAWTACEGAIDVLLAVAPARDPGGRMAGAAKELSANLTSAMAPARAHVMAEKPSLPALVDALRGDTNVLHLYAHAASAKDGPVLVMGDTSIDPATFASVLRASSVPLAILCDGAGVDQPHTLDDAQALLDFAARVVGTGVPAVLALPVALSDRGGPLFWQEFYRRLTRGELLDNALRAGRSLLRQQREPASGWYTPALCTTPDESALWPFARPATEFGTKQWSELLP